MPMEFQTGAILIPANIEEFDRRRLVVTVCGSQA